MDGTELPLLINQFTEIMAVDLKQSGATVDYSAYGGKILGICMISLRLIFHHNVSL